LNQINYRRCVACKKTAPKLYFWRVVRVGSSHVVQLDQGMGRSAYLCPTLDRLREAQKKNRLQGALRTKVHPNIYQSLHERLS